MPHHSCILLYSLFLFEKKTQGIHASAIVLYILLTTTCNGNKLLSVFRRLLSLTRLQNAFMTLCLPADTRKNNRCFSPSDVIQPMPVTQFSSYYYKYLCCVDIHGEDGFVQIACSSWEVLAGLLHSKSMQKEARRTSGGSGERGRIPLSPQVTNFAGTNVTSHQ